MNGNKECHFLLKTTVKVRDKFKEYCQDKQGVTMTQGMNALMKTASKKNFPIRTKVRMG